VEIPSIETKYGEIEAVAEPDVARSAFGRSAVNAHIQTALLRLRLGYAESVTAALDRYISLLRRYEELQLPDDPGQSLLMLAKEDVADALLKELEYPLQPVIPEVKKYATVGSYRKIPIPKELRWQVWERDDFTCQDCGTRRRLTVDHIIAEVNGGKTELSNLQTLCGPCNSRKGTR
jgi:5-methylcytosine-specific restriction protein A